MKLDLDEIESKARAATPGPWDAGGDPSDGVVYDEIKAVVHHIGRHPIAANTEYIAATSPPVVLALIAEIRALRAGADRTVTIADEAFGIGPIEPLDKTLKRIERGIAQQHRALAAARAFVDAQEACAAGDFAGDKYEDMKRALEAGR